MGKYMRKCKGIGEVAVMDVAHVGVRTRARALAMAASASSGTPKRRKIGGGESKFSNSSLVQLRSSRRRRVVVTPENSASPATSENSGPRTVSNDQFTASCCSSNASSDVTKERFKTVDPEMDSVRIESSTCDFDCRERRESTPSSEMQAESGDVESTARPSEANSRRKSSAEKMLSEAESRHKSSSAKMPSEAEIEEFFAAAENDLNKQLTEKFNFDFVKGVPLEGRYEWVRIKP